MIQQFQGLNWVFSQKEPFNCSPPSASSGFHLLTMLPKASLAVLASHPMNKKNHSIVHPLPQSSNEDRSNLLKKHHCTTKTCNHLHPTFFCIPLHQLGPVKVVARYCVNKLLSSLHIINPCNLCFCCFFYYFVDVQLCMFYTIYTIEDHEYVAHF